MRVARDDWARRRADRVPRPCGRAGASAAGPASAGRRSDTEPLDVVDRLDREGLLPAIVFIFSRVGCDAAVTAVPRRRTCG